MMHYRNQIPDLLSVVTKYCLSFVGSLRGMLHTIGATGSSVFDVAENRTMHMLDS